MDQRYNHYPALVGIDYGSKLAGTTVVAGSCGPGQSVVLAQSVKRRDADAFILEQLSDYSPGLVAIDAPLSLPGAYCSPDRYNDYQFRACDRSVRAMSPMFLGGLTARAIKLARHLRELGWTVIETYPRALSRACFPNDYHKKTGVLTPQLLTGLTELLQLETELPPVENYHQVDALLALGSAYRYINNTALAIGNEEGIIWV